MCNFMGKSTQKGIKLEQKEGKRKMKRKKKWAKKGNYKGEKKKR